MEEYARKDTHDDEFRDHRIGHGRNEKGGVASEEACALLPGVSKGPPRGDGPAGEEGAGEQQPIRPSLARNADGMCL